MRLGVRFPHKDSSFEKPELIRAWVGEVVSAGMQHVWSDDHVLGADPAQHPGWDDPYSFENSFHEPFVLFGFLAALAPELELVTAIVQLPYRQTPLVAKQAVELDVLTGGRLRLGVAVGHNHVEYEAMGKEFHNRGRRIDEQVALLRRLWTEPIVTFSGEYEKVTAAGLNPMPVQRPIPIWFGGLSDVAVRRAVRLGDGFVFGVPVADSWTATIGDLREQLEAAGRDPAGFGIDVRLDISGRTVDEWRREADELRELGVTHITLDTLEHRQANRGLDFHTTRLLEGLEAIQR